MNGYGVPLWVFVAILAALAAGMLIGELVMR